MEMRRMGTMLWVGLLVLAACAPPTPAPPPKAGTPYKIGFIASITGPGASLGVPERNVAQMVQAQLKAQGGDHRAGWGAPRGPDPDLR